MTVTFSNSLFLRKRYKGLDLTTTRCLEAVALWKIDGWDDLASCLCCIQPHSQSALAHFGDLVESLQRDAAQAVTSEGSASYWASKALDVIIIEDLVGPVAGADVLWCSSAVWNLLQ